MLLKPFALSALLVSSLSHLAVVSCAPQAAGSGSTAASSVGDIEVLSGTGTALPTAGSSGAESTVPSAGSSSTGATSSPAAGSNTGATSSPAASSSTGATSSSAAGSSTKAPASSTTTSASGASPSSSGTTGSGSSSGNSSNSTSSSNGGGSSAPHFLIYSDKYASNVAPSVSQIQGFDVVALSFYLIAGPAAQAQSWAQLDASTRQKIKSQYKSAGIKLIVSAFGSTELPTTSGADPTKLASDIATYVKNYDLDGVDVDYEDLGAMNAGDGKAEQWLITFTTALRQQLSQGQILTHAPVAPWFNNETYKGGGYVKINEQVGDKIDWYNIQFYNQNDYEDCTTLLTQSKTKTSLFEIAQTGVELDKLVLGKPATPADASNGYIAPATLANCVSQAKQKNWNGGIMVWQFPDADSSWIKTVRGSAFPESN